MIHRDDRCSLSQALDAVGLDEQFVYFDKLPLVFYDPDFTKELARYICNYLEGLRNGR